MSTPSRPPRRPSGTPKAAGLAAVVLTLCAAGGQARGAAQSANDQGDEPTVSELVVKGAPPPPQPGAVVGDIKPEVQLSPADIQSYGVSTMTELLQELSPETRSDRGRGGGAPVVLLNGRRISSFAEIQNIPTEAILRIDILPEEVSLKYGYSADQRVVNVVLRRRFRAVSGELEGGGATEGGEAQGQAETDLLHLRGDRRLNLDLKYVGATDITDADRGIEASPNGAPPPSGVTDPGRYRTLQPATQSITANAVLAKPIGAGVNATVNATLGATTSDGLQGLPTDIQAGAPSPLRQSIDGLTAHLGGTLNKDLARWRLSLTGAWDFADTHTRTDTSDTAFPRSTAQVTTNSGNIQFLGNGPIVNVPAGPFFASVKIGDTYSGLASSSDRFGVTHDVALSRNDFNAQLNLDLPLTSRRNHVLPWIGDITLNGNAAVDDLSDLGVLDALGYGVSWTPIPGLNLIASHTRDQAAPTIQQLGNPLVSTPGARVFDFATGQTVDVTQINGGNPDLVPDRRDITKIGLTLKPLPKQDLTITANYVESRIRNAIATFPSATLPIEMAYPDRFVRDEDGELIEENLTPVNFAEQDRQELRWGFNYARPLGKQPPPRFARFRPPPGEPGAAAGSGPPDAGGRGGGGGYGGGYGGGRGGYGGGRGAFTPFNQGGRLQLAVYHTLYFSDRILARPGGPVLDLLGGSPTGASGGQYRNEIEGQLGATLHGYGARISVDWREGTVVDGPLGDLAFSPITAVNLRLFDNLGQQRAVLKHYPWLRGTRVTLNVNNLFDQRVTVTGPGGVTPLSYSAGYVDPVGRTILLSVRKLFF